MNERSRGRLLLLALVLGIFVGVGGYTFVYARGYSYLLDDPNVCVNCHIMRPQFEQWRHSTHHAVATCNDCHTPSSFPEKYIVKGENGFWHSYRFTFQNFPEPIRIRPGNSKVLEQNCRRCHDGLVGDISHGGHRDPVNCVKCHMEVGHAGHD